MTSGDSKIAKLQTDFQALSEIATELNSASDGLTKTVAILDEALKKLNVGLNAWVTFCDRGDDDQPEQYDLEQIGYCKINGTWGLALQHIWGDESMPRPWQRTEGPWLFNDAPRELRLRSVDTIPKVIAELAKEAFETTRKLQEKTKEVLELANAITQVANDAKVRAKSLTLAERVAAGQKSLTGKLSDLAGSK
jgi:prefoldin subunit 5